MINAPTDTGQDYLGGLGNTLFVGGLLDHFTHQGLVAGYSCSRKLIGTASLAYRLNRDSDQANKEIGFVGNNIDTEGVLAFLGANSGGVERLYDQVQFNHLIDQGVGGDWTVASLGALITRDGFPVMRRTAGAAETAVYVPNSFTDINNCTIFHVASLPNNSYQSSITSADFSDDINIEIGTANATLDSVLNTQGAAAFVANSIHLYVFRYNSGTGVITYFANGVNVGTDSQVGATLSYQRAIRSNGQSEFLELLYFDNDLSDDDVSAVSQNIIDHYGI